ncbi:MAG: Sensory/regulatory protein RpfC [Pseudomonadota bacterium]|jgi:CheY-like chemotaxis protein/CHASE3 domain sensor protein
MPPDDRAGARSPLDASLPPKTFAGFLAATVALFLISFLSYRALEARTDNARRMAHTLDVTRLLGELMSTLKDAETGQRGFLITGEQSFLEPYEAAVPALPGELSALRRAAEANPTQLEQLDRLQALATRKMAELGQSIELKRAGRSGAAADLGRAEDGKQMMDQIRALTAEMTEAERTLLAERTREWEASVGLSALVTWGGSALLLFLVIAAATMSSRDFRAQRVQEWLQTGQAELGKRLQGELDVRAIADKLASFLAGYLDAQLAALYYIETPGQLLRVGSYALPASRLEDRSPSGLTKQAFQERTLLVVRDVPDNYFEVSSGLGQGRPRHLLIAPLETDGICVGVLELAFFKPIAPHQIELLKRSGEAIGVGLRSARYRREVQDLLEETQGQSEELQTQQEELRVQNEELEQQTRALQESEARLQNQQAELEQINSQLEEQTQSLEQQRDDLERAQGELQRANTYKSEFLANMSHELRTPLNSALILARLLTENRDGNLTAEQVKFAQTIYSAGNDLLTLINDILDLSKIEAGKLDVRPEDVPLRRMSDDLVDAFHSLAREKGLELAISIAGDAPATLHTDSTRLQQILKNLLSNAIKFTERGGVSLAIQRAAGGKLAFEVRDTGIGIAAEQHEVIFEAFRQADGTTNRKYGGTGLGLSISRDLATLLGGELTLVSVPGKGSTFTLLLPAQPPGEAVALRERISSLVPVLPRVSRPRSTSNGHGNAAAAHLVPAGGPVPDDREQLAPGSRIVLIVEDDVAFAQVVVDLVHELDFQAVVAYSAEEGLALAERHKPSAIVLDLGLPDRSGLTVLDALKHRPATRHIPVHVVSGSDHAHTALEMGAAGYAIKPIQREHLLEALKRLEDKFTKKLRRVLVVEDDDVHRDSTCRLLAGDDVETVAVGTAAEALEQLGKATFDCMVLDLTLPDRSGLELLEEMSQKQQYAFPPVIVYTGRSLTRDQEQELRRFSSSIIIKGARSPERLLDEVTLFLHQVEADLPPDRQRMLRDARHREAVFEGRRVLVVEDDVRNIFALSSVLEPKGAKVEIARNGREALAHLAQKPGVDLVLMDIMMGEMDGLEATREIRKRPELARLPIIALTAKAMADDREQCLAAGANDYIAKPFDVDKLLSLARVWMPK